MKAREYGESSRGGLLTLGSFLSAGRRKGTVACVLADAPTNALETRGLRTWFLARYIVIQ